MHSSIVLATNVFTKCYNRSYQLTQILFNVRDAIWIHISELALHSIDINSRLFAK
jgi:hypothetical protein